MSTKPVAQAATTIPLTTLLRAHMALHAVMEANGIELSVRKQCADAAGALGFYLDKVGAEAAVSGAGK